MPRTTGVFVKRAAKRKRPTKRAKARKVRRLTNKKIKDIVSRKKRDTMAVWSPFANPTAPFGTPPVRGVSFSPRPNATDQPHWNLWCASYRPLLSSATDAVRNTQRVYMKGLSDTYRVEIENAPWEWRRIVFHTHDRFVGATAQTATYLNNLFQSAPVSNTRVIGQGSTVGQPAISLATAPSTQIDPFANVFKGERGADWNSYFTALTDNNQIKVLSDKKFRLSSGNESGAAKIKKFYTPVNKMLEYDDDENGVNQTTNGWVSNGSKTGNIYVLDMFWNETGADITNAGMTWTSNSTMYWHEA